jgi:hypothetical protein
MKTYNYMMVQVDPQCMFEDHRGRDPDNTTAADYLQHLVSSCAQDGWEFYRIDPFGMTQKPGCLGILFGQREIVFNVYIVTFRREVLARY